MRSRPVVAWATGALALAASSLAMAQPAATRLPDDRETTVNGVRAACTGVGLAARQDPRWAAFPVRLEVSAAGGDYLGEVTLALSTGKGAPLLAVSCDSPWVLLGLPPGDYPAEIWSGRQGPKRANLRAPAKGQARFVVAFP